MAEDLYAGDYPPEVPGSENVMSGLTQKVQTKQPLGRRPPAFDKRKFGYDRLAGMSGNPVQWHVSKDDRMEAREAGIWLNRIHAAFGLNRAQPEELEAFNKSLFFCHTINSGSVLQPGRSKLYVRGEAFPFDTVVKMLGVNIRRFFRAFADDVREVNKEVLADYTPFNAEKAERHDWLIEVAADRGLARHPDLAHDSADKCLGLSHAERMAVANSKVSVFANIINAADRLNSSARVIGSDPYDSTNMKTVAGAAASE